MIHPPAIRDCQNLDSNVLLGPLDDRWGLLDVLAEDVALDEVRKPHLELVADETLRRD